MHYNELRKALDITRSPLVIDRETLTENIALFLADCYREQGYIISISNARYGENDDKDGVVEIIGESRFLNRPSLPVTLRADIKDGAARLILDYVLPWSVVPGQGWRFSQSFPTLPTVTDWSKRLSEADMPAFDSLLLKTPRFTVSSESGIHFNALMKPGMALGVLRGFLDEDVMLPLSGKIKLPKPGEAPLPLPERVFPWNTDASGISLYAPLLKDMDLGPVKLSQIAYRAYSPTDEEWRLENGSYYPRSAYTATASLSVSDAEDISAEAFAFIDEGTSKAVLRMFFEGVSVSHLAALAHLSPAGDLAAFLPDALKALPVGGLELIEAFFEFVWENDPVVSALGLTIGMPRLNWDLGLFTVENLFCRFAVFPGGAGAETEVGVTVYGTVDVYGVRLNVYAARTDGFTVITELADGVTIPVSKILEGHMGTLPVPGDLTVDAFKLGVCPGKYYQMALLMAKEPNPWVINIGLCEIKLKDLTLFFTKPSDGNLRGTISGAADFGDFARLSVRYDLPGNLLLRAEFPEIDLRRLIAGFTGGGDFLPDGFNFTFYDSSVLVQKFGDAYTFRFGTRLDKYGVFIAEVRKAQSGTGFMLGLNLLGGLSSLPGLSGLGFIENLFQFDSLLVVLSTIEDARYAFPDMSYFENPVLAKEKFQLPGSGGVIAGFNAYGKWTLNSGDKQQALLGKLLGIDAISVTLQVGKSPLSSFRFFTSMMATICGHALQCTFGAAIQNSNMALFLEGDMDVAIQGHIQHFCLGLYFNTNGALLAASMTGSDPIDVAGLFKIGNLALEICVSWEGVPGFGIAGTITSGAFNSSIAVFFDSTNPSNSLLAGSVSDLTLSDIIGAFVPEAPPSSIDALLTSFAILGTSEFTAPETLADKLDESDFKAVQAAFAEKGVNLSNSQDALFLTVSEPGKRWFLTDKANQMRHYQMVSKNGHIAVSLEAQFYFAPNAVSIGRLTFAQGFFVNCRLRFFGFEAMAKVAINAKGFAFKASMDAIVLGHEKLFSIKAACGEGGPLLSVSTYAQPDEDEPFKEPHIYVNGSVTVLGLSASIYAKATKKGLDFNFSGSFFGFLDFDAHAAINGITDMALGANVRLGLGVIDLGLLGKLEINTGVGGSFEIEVSDTGFSNTVQAYFELLGKKYYLVNFSLDIGKETLEDLKEIITEKIKDFFKGLLVEAAAWALMVAKGVITGVKDMTMVLVDVFGLSNTEAGAIIAKAFEIAEDTCSTTTALSEM